jgi:hypothetical protein
VKTAFLVLGTAILVAASPLVAQAPSPGAPPGSAPLPATPGRKFFLPIRFAGDVTTSGELYQVNGIESRRPGQAWRVSFTPQVTFFGEFSMGLNVLLSSEGSDVKQSISQLGFSPRYKWATLHLGDFTQNYSEYTMQGTRIRGAGFDLRPGAFRFSAQGGQSQRTVIGGASNMTYRRSLYAASAGIGREGSSAIDFTVLRATDDPSSLAPALADTMMLDTIPAALRPRIETRPQDNLVLGMQSRLNLFSNRLVLRGQAAGALITRDVESPDVVGGSVEGAAAAGGVIPLHLSTSGDYSYRLDVETNFGGAALNGGYEYVGAGYTSLGLSYIINDRRAYNLGGNVRLLKGHLNLQGTYQHQNDNLLGQKLATTNRDAISGTVMIVLGRRLTTSVTALLNTTLNDSPVDTFRIDNRAFALMMNSSIGLRMLGRQTPVTLSYALQRTADDNAIVQVPDVSVQNVSTAVQIPLFGTLSISPTASIAVTETATTAAQRNTYFGLKGQARLKKVRASLSAMQTFSNSRGVFGLNGQMNYTLPGGPRLTIQGRHNRYDAIGSRPAFQETFSTMTLARSF